MSPVNGIEILAGLLPIHIHVYRLYKLSIIQYQTLPASHILPFIATLHATHSSNYLTAYHVRSKNHKLNHPLQLILASSFDTFKLISHSLLHIQPEHHLMNCYPQHVVKYLEHPQNRQMNFRTG